MLHVVFQVAHILSPHPVVQDFVKSSTGTAGKNAEEYLITKWLIPKNCVAKKGMTKKHLWLICSIKSLVQLCHRFMYQFFFWIQIYCLIFRLISNSLMYLWQGTLLDICQQEWTLCTSLAQVLLRPHQGVAALGLSCVLQDTWHWLWYE